MRLRSATGRIMTPATGAHGHSLPEVLPARVPARAYRTPVWFMAAGRYMPEYHASARTLLELPHPAAAAVDRPRALRGDERSPGHPAPRGQPLRALGPVQFKAGRPRGATPGRGRTIAARRFEPVASGLARCSRPSRDEVLTASGWPAYRYLGSEAPCELRLLDDALRRPRWTGTGWRPSWPSTWWPPCTQVARTRRWSARRGAASASTGCIDGAGGVIQGNLDPTPAREAPPRRPGRAPRRGRAAPAPGPRPRKALTQYHVDTWTTADDLPQNSVDRHPPDPGRLPLARDLRRGGPLRRRALHHLRHRQHSGPPQQRDPGPLEDRDGASGSPPAAAGSPATRTATSRPTPAPTAWPATWCAASTRTATARSGSAPTTA